MKVARDVTDFKSKGWTRLPRSNIHILEKDDGAAEMVITEWKKRRSQNMRGCDLLVAYRDVLSVNEVITFLFKSPGRLIVTDHTSFIQIDSSVGGGALKFQATNVEGTTKNLRKKSK